MGKHKKDKKDKGDKKERKSMMKLLESADDRRKRRLAKKAKKQAKRLESETVAGYTNEANPFGDNNLAEKFVWHKKIVKDGGGGREARKSKGEEMRRRAEVTFEIEKVKQRRKEREEEREAWDAEKDRMQREEDFAAHDDYKKAEDEFHVKQSLMRSSIRINEGRAKPIDRITQNLASVGKEDFDIEVEEPYKIFDGLGTQDVEDFREEIQMRVDVDKPNSEFWECMMVVCDHAHQEAKMEESGHGGQHGVHSAIDQEIEGVLKGKSVGDLDKMESQVNDKITGDASVDVEYWETLLRKLKVQKARAQLREFHSGLLSRHLEALELEGVDAFGRTREDGATSDSEEDGEKAEAKEPKEGEEWDEEELEKEGDSTAMVSSAGRDDFSPELFDEDDIEDGEEVMDEEAATEELAAQRAAVLVKEEQKRLPAPVLDQSLDPADAMYQREAAKQMAGDEEQFTGGEVDMGDHHYAWHDKFRPRKPRYFNRVHTGYSWNKYNQTHYDHDNPPPKVVQGYKFNIFYPDLIDRAQTPSYVLEKVADAPDMCTIRFKAGAPYEDIAFQIMNKEWQYARKRGFKCTFERGILHLYFNFERSFYRR